MQNRYAGDIGDFSKFALLRALAGNDLRVGILWYLNAVEEENRDGILTSYSNLRKYDIELYDKLTVIANGKRSVEALERARLMPASTAFYSAPIPRFENRRNPVAALSDRLAWMHAAEQFLQTADLVFLDPDNGLAPRTITKSSIKSVKYAFVDEIEHLLNNSHSVVLYQHNQRRPLGFCISAQMNLFRTIAETWALSFHIKSVRTYLVLANSRHRNVLWSRTIEFMRSPLGLDGCFRLHTDECVEVRGFAAKKPS